MYGLLNEAQSEVWEGAGRKGVDYQNNAILGLLVWDVG